MPLPSSENDLKRRARRRLIGAVALTLLAVIILPLLLEDEPPPASSLAVRMAVPSAPIQEPAGAPAQVAQPAAVAKPEEAVAPEPVAAPEPETHAAPAARPMPAPRPEPARTEPAKPAPQPQPPKPVAPPAVEAKPAAIHEGFVVQLAALSDASKAQQLMARAAKIGLPAFTDKVGNLTRVRVGPYPKREAAVAAAVKLAENNLPGQVVAQ